MAQSAILACTDDLGSGAMAQPSSKIAEAFRGGDERQKGDAKLRGDSANSKNVCDLADASAQPQCCKHPELTEKSTFRPRLVLAEPVARPTPEPSLGIGGLNLEPGPVPGGDVTPPAGFEPPSGTRRLLISEPMVTSSPHFGKYSAALIMCAGVAMGALAALYLVACTS